MTRSGNTRNGKYMGEDKRRYHTITNILQYNLIPDFFTIFAKYCITFKNMTMEKIICTNQWIVWSIFKRCQPPGRKRKQSCRNPCPQSITRTWKTPQTFQKRVTRSLEVIFTLVSTVWKWRHSVYHIEKKLFVSQRGGFISCDKIKYQLCEISISLLKKQLYFRISVGFRRCIVGNFSLTNSDNTFGRYSMSFQFCSNQASSWYIQRIVDTWCTSRTVGSTSYSHG